MLDSLYVRNLALIDEAELAFTEGLNILSGETGAGKSIVIGSVLIALGEKVPRDVIRNNEKEAYIELIFSPSNPAVVQKLAKHGISLEDGQLIISRRITASRSVCRINGEACPASKVREIAALLVDVHGQQDHQALLQPHRQLEIVDRSAGKEVAELKERMYESFRLWAARKEEYEGYNANEDERLRRIDILQYETEELENASITPGEEERLSMEWKQLSQRERIVNAYQEAAALAGYDSGACDLLGRAEQALKAIEEIDSNAKEVCAQLCDAEAILHDACAQAEDCLSALQEDERDPKQLEERLDEIRHLMQKYRCDEKGLLALLQKKKAELEKYRNFDEEKLHAHREYQNACKNIREAAGKLSEKRRECAEILSKQLKEALVDLNFLDVRFEIRMEETPQIGPGGKDSAVFYIATNPGEALKPLASVASGGELSRIMLAVKSVMAKKEEIETLIFDEIDTGISGRTAQKVAKRLAVTAKESQVICISHLAQIVSMADTHFLIEKDASRDVTTTHINPLSDKQSIKELARLLGGEEITKNVLDTAKEMKDMAARAKGLLPE